MVGRKRHLHLAVEECDTCGICLGECTEGSLRVGPGYIYVDWSACPEGCRSCADACDRGAIVVRDPARRDASPGVRSEGAVTTISHGGARGATGSRTRSRWGRDGASTAGQGTRAYPEWSLGEVLAVIGSGIALLAARDALLSSSFARGLSVQGLVTLRAGAQVAYYGSLLGVLGALSRRRGIGFARAFGLVRTAWLSSAAWVVAGLFAVRLISTMYGAISQGLGWAPPTRAVSQFTTWFGADILGLALAMGTVVVLGPFVEEVVFRGMLLPALRRVTSPWIAIVISALLFAASHLTLWTFLPLAVLGVALGWLATTKGSVWPAVALHAGYNAVAVVAAFYVTGTVGA